MSAVVNLSDLDAVTKFRNINSKSVVYLTATWCPPCKMISPIYDELSKDDAFHQVAFGKVGPYKNWNFILARIHSLHFKTSTKTRKVSGSFKHRT